MMFLAGLLGMMVLGSVAMLITGEDGTLGTAGTEDEDDIRFPEDALAEQDGDGGDGDGASGDVVAGYVEGGASDLLDAMHNESHDEIFDPFEESLFARLGLINLPGVIQEGGDSGDTMIGADQTDLLHGGAGDDLVEGRASDDQLHGGRGADTLLGGDGNDTLHGEAGDDLAEGGQGDDAMFGHAGDDTLDGQGGNDELYGGLGADILAGGAGSDALHGREGADTLLGGQGEDSLMGGFDDDLLIGVAPDDQGTDHDGRDFLNGGDGDDVLLLGQEDVATGGAGQDSFVIGSWIEAAPAEIMDFDKAQDQLVIIFDSSEGGGEPELDIRQSADDPELAEIVLDGQVLTVIALSETPNLEDIAFLDAHSAALLGLDD